MIYLASPYTDGSKAVMESRYNDVRRATADLMNKGHVVFSPIVHGHNIFPLLEPGNQTDRVFWYKQSFKALSCCEELYVLRIDGWEDSIGVQVEIIIAGILGMDIYYIGAPE